MITIDDLKKKMSSIEKMIPIKQHRRRIQEIDELSSAMGFWEKPMLAGKLMQERGNLSGLISAIEKFQDDVDFAELVPEACNEDRIERLFKELVLFGFRQMMSGKNDVGPAIISIVAGSGGFEAADFTRMLFRMYGRFVISKGLDVEIIDEKKSEDHSDVCIDSISIRITGLYAYGLMRSECGVHRLIRSSPFNANNLVQTSFAAVDIVADINDDIDIKIEDKDVEITATTSGKKGGQNSNKVCSAIRIKHLPTNISVFARTERDQLANKRNAFRILKAKLYALEENKRKEIQDQKVANTSEASFGHKVRTYSYISNIVKDHRSGFECKNVDRVLDGDLEEIIMSVLSNRKCE